MNLNTYKYDIQDDKQTYNKVHMHTVHTDINTYTVGGGGANYNQA